MEQRPAKPEFQAILLAGGAGSRMSPLQEKVAKCLLPVGNRPLISYQLDMLEKAGLKECLVVTTKHISQQVSLYFEKYEGKMRCSVHVVADHTGTAEALRHIAERIVTDFIVVSADVITDVKLLVMADTHRSHDALVTFMLTESSQQGVDEKKKPAATYKPECNFIGLEDRTSRVLLYTPKAYVKEMFRVSKRLLQRHSSMRVHSRMEDSHIYIFSHNVIKIIMEEKNLSSLQNEVLPLLVKMQFDDSKDSKEKKKQFTQIAALEMSSVPPKTNNLVSCMAYLPEGGQFCMRVNTVAAFKYANREIGSLSDSDGKVLISQRGPFADQAVRSKKDKSARPPFNVGKDCIVGISGVQIGNKSTLKKSVIGNYCKIGAKCRISNCVLMDHVTIEDQVTLTDTVVCSNAHIQKNSSLDNCEVGSNFTVEAKTKSKKEKFSNESILA
eukprot:CAMPEP_0167756968 /NCGR_PEP_ID=MMETSP0110_2-20121227/9673_1 /TAXON_ID=629695 /ORGANISM="Gymnochlora sp., Strain CCMP2014" /LENGTH=441 /DNA_ID=CAMNT_0007643123 /DNA_START=108 /DNA_END=1433 /DNA_ORIENTATION=+